MDNNIIYRVKTNIANSTSAPAGNPNNYQAISYAFTPISQNQVGTHPAFSNQNDLNLYLLSNSSNAVKENVFITNAQAI